MFPQPDWFGRLMLFFAGVLGAGGVASAAVASHLSESRVLSALALIALTHAPACLGFGLVAPTGRHIRASAIAIGLGASLFCGALAVAHILDIANLPLLAPLGATAMVAGWISVAVAALLRRSQ